MRPDPLNLAAKYNRAVVAATLHQRELTYRRRRLIGDLILLLVAVIWGGTFVIQRMAALEGGLYLFNGARFIIGALVLVPVIIPRWLRRTDAELSPSVRAPEHPFLRIGSVFLAGLLLALGSSFQQSGMRYTTAGNAGFITGLYVVLIPFILGVFLRRTPRPVVLLAAVLAATGLYLLSVGGSMQVNRGDGMVLIGTLFWALHVILVGWIVKRVDVLVFASGQYLVCGLVSLGLGFAVEEQGLSGIADLWWLIIFMGVFTIAVGFTLQAIGQRTAPPADAAIILSTETVFAALAGWLFLNEQLTPAQILGCAVMLLGMLLAQADVLKPSGGDELDA